MKANLISSVRFSIRWFGPVMFGLAMSHAQAANTGTNVYIGGGLSVVRASGLGGQVDGALASQGITSASSADGRSTSGNLKLGYRVNPNFAVEATYDRVGTLNVQSNISVPSADTAAGSWKAQGYGLHALGILPIDGQWSVTGRLGLEQWNTKFNTASNAGGTTNVSTSSNHLGFALGAGAAYAISRNVDATAELVHYTGVGDAGTTGRTGLNAFNLGLRYHFM